MDTIETTDIQNFDDCIIESDTGEQSSEVQVSVNLFSPTIKSYKFKLSKEEKLNQVRNRILNEEKSNGIRFDYFLSKKNEPILHEEESNLPLESILRESISKNYYHIQIVDVWTKLIEMIEQGFVFEDNLVNNAPKVAFTINKDKIKSIIFKAKENSTIPEFFNYEEEKIEECKRELDILCARNLISYKDSTIVPWLSIFLGKSKEASLENLKNKMTTEIFITKFKKAEIFISKEYIILTEEFKRKIKKTINSNKNYHEIMDNLREITKDYGYFYARHIVFGGAIIEETNPENSTYPRIIGGGNFGKQPSPKEFAESLKDFKKWRIIEYSDICSIFDLLDDELRKKVLDLLGYRILKADIKDIPLNHDFSEKKFYIYSLAPQLEELSKITNIQDCHIFASIMNKDDGVFSLRVEYINDESSPAIVVHNITNIQNKYPIRIGWIIVGQPNNFDFHFVHTEYPIVLKSKKCSVSYKAGKHYRIEIPDFDGSCMLSTCVLETPSKTTQATFVVGSHIIPSSHLACIFVHDLKDNTINDDELFQKLKLFVCTIDANQKCNGGQLNINWIKDKNHPNVFHSGEEMSSIFSGNKKTEKAENLYNQLILVDQLFENCWNHGFINVNSKGIIFKGLNTPSLDSERIGYFLIPKISN
ncbi:23671_t:CDS:2 [Cetraspora pellucida]|uniref:23671_t:CDS:1 n=1 Tax=Cetraspora pellucida TaxID=1433469 RepID=A0A9N8ZAY4_9GLOM|nr:23671_t:CDS:2 [Cetraspora pellucida]